MAKGRNVLFIVLFGGAAVIAFSLIMIYVFAVIFIDREMPIGDAIAVVDITGEIYYDREKIKEIEKQSGREMRTVTIQTDEREIETVDKHIFIIGKEKSMIEIPKETGDENDKL